MGFVFSPSNLSTFKDCPRRFQAQSITKELQWKPSKQKTRGTAVHDSLERAVKKGFDQVKTWPDGMDTDFTRNKINTVRQCMVAGADVHTEHELVINRGLKPAEWWGEDAWLRARADMLVLPKDKASPAVVVDFKTGKKWDNDCFQLRIESLLVHYLYQYPVVQYSYWYVDQGETVTGSIDFRNGLTPVEDLLQLILDADRAIQSNTFFPKKNRFCNWCDLHKTPGCGL